MDARSPRPQHCCACFLDCKRGLSWDRTNRRYGELKFHEADLASRQLSAEERRHALQQLDRTESEIVRSRFPLELANRVYTLRQHLDYVRTQLERQAESR